MKDQHKIIDDYVRGILNEKEIAAFELKIEKDEVLQQEVQFRKTIVNSFKLEKVKQTIKQAKIEKEMETKLNVVTTTIDKAKAENIASKKSKIKLFRRLSIAAAFLLMIGVGWFYYTTVNEQFLFADIVIKKSELTNVAAFNIEQIESLVDKANVAIDKTDYNLVLSLTDQLRKEQGFETDEILQNECYIYFKKQNYTKAARKVEGVKDLELQNKVRWKLSALYLDVSERDLAKQQLLKIQEGSYKKKAERKLKKLN